MFAMSSAAFIAQSYMTRMEIAGTNLQPPQAAETSEPTPSPNTVGNYSHHCMFQGPRKDGCHGYLAPITFRVKGATGARFLLIFLNFLYESCYF